MDIINDLLTNVSSEAIWTVLQLAGTYLFLKKYMSETLLQI